MAGLTHYNLFLSQITYTVPRDETKFRRRLARQRHHLHVLTAQFHNLWQAFLDLGILFHLNIPWTVYSDSVEDHLGHKLVCEAAFLRRTYDIEYDEQAFDFLADFSDYNRLFVSAEKSLRSNDMARLRRRLRSLERMADDLRTEYVTLKHSYENVLAGVNALKSAGKLATDNFKEERLGAFKTWSEAVDALSRYLQGDVGPWLVFAQEHGDVDEFIPHAAGPIESLPQGQPVP